MSSLKVIMGCLLGASFFLACGQKDSGEKSEEIKSSKEIVNPNGDSELALLMRSMFDESMAAKKLIQEGKPAPNFSEEFVAIHTAKETDPNVRTEEFRSLSEFFLKQVAVLEKAGPEERISAHNNMVASCLACHAEYCPGPMLKIKKLRIKES